MRALALYLRLFAWLFLASLLAAGPARASVYSAELSQQLLHGPDLCAEAPCRDVMPQASKFSLRKGRPSYVEALAVGPDKAEKVVGYVFLSTDVVDIPAYSDKPIVTLIGMDTHGIITGVRVLKHSEPILLAGIAESTLLKFIGQYTGKSGDAKLEIGHGDEASGTVGLDAISGATVTVIAENQVISRSAYDIGRQVGIFKGEVRPAPRYTPLNERLSWQQLLDEGSVVHFPLQRKEVGLAGDAAYIDMYFGHLNVPSVGISLLGEPVYKRLMADLKPDEQAIFIIANGEASFKGSGFVRGGIYDRIQVRQDPQSFTFRDTDYLNLYGVQAPGAPAFTESAVFIVRSANFNPAWPWQLTFLANKADPQSGAKTFVHFNAPYWLPARYLEGGRPHIVQPEATWRAIWKSKIVQIVLFLLTLAFTALMYSQRDKLVRASKRKHKPWISRPRHMLWLVSVAFLGFYLKAQPSITQVLTWFHSLIHQWKWELFLSDPFIFLFWWFIIVSVLVWGRGVFCGWLCPFGSLQQLALSLGKAAGLARFQKLLPKPLHDKLKWIKYAIFVILLLVSFYSMEMAERLAEVEPFKTTFIVGVWNRSWPFWVFIGAILGWSFLSERPYCKYLCPLGAGLAIPGKFRLFGLKRKAECQTCHACAAGCGSHAIDSAGRIDQMECMLCLDCMILYYDDHACPPLVKERKVREKNGDALTPINAGGYFISLDSVRGALKAKAAPSAGEPP
ncbi:4Fe-4S binding protein [Massilia antarctica]|uniref:4Fe-4S binding protein n=1 Tax=Massilia antarctica TaxID=2765360 RepID=UPI00226FB097|nr:4Fe-4S binding protein [Massilia sp. H27-R4]MCY0914240.1 4Fe-4S binding protein [Massilia sp. H27-R4]